MTQINKQGHYYLRTLKKATAPLASRASILEAKGWGMAERYPKSYSDLFIKI